MSTIKISELATSAISLTDFFAKADANGIANKNTVQGLSNVINASGSSVFRGSLAIADTPTLDGWYFPSESGTYTNAGGVVVTLLNNLNIIIISGTQTVFELLIIPVSISLETTFDETNNTDGATMKAIADYNVSINSIQTLGDNSLSDIDLGDRWIDDRSSSTAYNVDKFEMTTGALTYSGLRFLGVTARKYYVEFDFYLVSGTAGKTILIGDGTSESANNIVLTTEITTTNKRFKGFVTLAATSLGFYQLENESGNVYAIGNVLIDSNYAYYEKLNDSINDNFEVNQLVSLGDNQLNGTLVGSSLINRRSGVLSYNVDHFELATGAETYTGFNYIDLEAGKQYFLEVNLWLISGNLGQDFFIGNSVLGNADTYKIEGITSTPTKFKIQVTPTVNEIGFYQQQSSITEVYGISDIRIYEIKEGKNIDTNSLSVKDGESNLFNNNNLYNSFTWTDANLNAKMLTYGHYLFVCEYQRNEIIIFDIRNENSPVEINAFSVSSKPRDIKIVNGYLFVACFLGNKIEVYNIDILTSTNLVYTISDVSAPKAMTVVDNYLYVVNSGTSTLRKYEMVTISDTPTITYISEVTGLGSILLDADFNGVDEIGVCGLSDTVNIINKNTNAKRSITISTSNFSNGRFLNKNIFIACDRINGVLYFIDISQTTPFVMSQVSVPVSGEEITIVGNRIYLPELTDSPDISRLSVVDITNLFKPILLAPLGLSISGAGFTAFRNGFLYVSGHWSPYNIDVIKVENGFFDYNKNIYTI